MSEIINPPEKVSLRSRLYSSAALARDPDETEGRKLYRTRADSEAFVAAWLEGCRRKVSAKGWMPCQKPM